jgi:hypothetical protein
MITRWSPERVIGPVEAAYKPAALELEKVAQGLAPRRTGRLAAGTHMTFTGGTTGFLSASGVPYAGPVIKGTRAHTETSSTPMPIGGGMFAYSVQHPATAPHPYLKEAAASFRPLFVNTARGLLHLGF